VALRTRWPLVAAVLLFATLASLLEPRPLDLRVYWEAAQRVFIDGTEPYTRAAGQGLPFTYPPTALFLLRPLASLTLEQAANLMFALNIGLSLAVMLLLPRDLAWTGASPNAGSTRLARWGGLYLACFGGLYLTLYFHQVNLLILLCLWGYWRVLRRGGKAAGSGYCGIDPARRPEHEHASLSGLAAGAALALGSVAKPHYALLIASTIGCVRRVRPIGRGAWVLLGAGIASACLLWLSLSVAPAGSWSAWLELVPGSTSYSQLPPGHSSIAAPWNRAIPGELARWLIPNKFTDPVVASPALATAFGTVVVTGLGLATAWAVSRSLRVRAQGHQTGDPGSDPVAIDLELSLISVWVFLAAPASWTHHLVMLLPAALVLLRDAVLDPTARAGHRFAAVLVLAAIALTLDDLIPRDVRTGSHAIMGLITVAVLGLWLLLFQRLLTRLRLLEDHTDHE
jgi:hypothetical protein